MSFFYKYVDLSTDKDTSSESSSDETRALIESHEREKPDSYSNNVEDKGNESEFWYNMDIPLCESMCYDYFYAPFFHFYNMNIC